MYNYPKYFRHTTPSTVIIEAGVNFDGYSGMPFVLTGLNCSILTVDGVTRRNTSDNSGLEKSGRIVAFCDWNAKFCDQKTLCSRNVAPKTRRPGASLRPDEHSSRPDSENKT